MRSLLELGVEEVVIKCLKRYNDFDEKELNCARGQDLVELLVDYFMTYYDECNKVTHEMVEGCLMDWIVCKNNEDEINSYVDTYDDYEIILQNDDYVVIQTY